MTTDQGAPTTLCPYCFAEVTEQPTDCPTCAAPHHAACYAENGGCAVLGCRTENTPTDSNAPETADASTSSTPPSASADPAGTRVTYRPGDIANGHVLTANNEWVSLGSTTGHESPVPAHAGTASISSPHSPASAQSGGYEHFRGYGAPPTAQPGQSKSGGKAGYWIAGLLAFLVLGAVINANSAPGSGSSSSGSGSTSSSSASYSEEVRINVSLDSLESCYYAEDYWDYEDVDVYDGDGNLLGSDYLTSDGSDSYGDCQFSTSLYADESPDGVYKIWVGSDYVTRTDSDIEYGSLDVSLTAD